MKNPLFARAALLALLLALLLSPARSTADWATFAFDYHVRVQLPAPPKLVDMQEQLPVAERNKTRVFQLTTPQAIFQLIRMQTDIAALGLRGPAQRQDYYQGVSEGLLEGHPGDLIVVTDFESPAGAGQELSYYWHPPTGGGRRVHFTRSLLVGNVSYLLTFIPTGPLDSLGTASSEERRRFFDSITVRP